MTEPAEPMYPPIVELLTRVMTDVQTIAKDQRNTEQGYNFRGIDAVVNAVGPVLRKHGVVVLPMLQRSAWRDVRTVRDKPSREVTVEVCYRFYGPAGDHVDAIVPGESMDFGDKGAAKAMSVAYRIALLQALCIPTDEIDPDAQSYERDDGPSERATGLAILVTDAADEVELKAAWSSVDRARAAGEITSSEAVRLNDMIKTRKDELVPPS